ncbi:MAG TPA: hypothetical protein VEU33_29745 [Archangium sp.]|nr:hypothetical protein [Archangium sp.]
MISYDLRGEPAPDRYKRVEEFIKANSTSWARPMLSQWFVDTPSDVSTWFSALKSVFDESKDRYFVCRIHSGSYMGFVDTAIVQWLQERVF